MSYVQIDSFALDKASAAIYEGIALKKIEQWYAGQGLRIHVRYIPGHPRLVVAVMVAE